MSFTLILFIGILGVLVVIFLKKLITGMIGDDYKVVHNLKSAKWFQNHWLGGIFLFAINVVLFFSTGLVLYLLLYFSIPFVHLIVMILAVIVSIFSWVLINHAWQGTKSNRLKMGFLGSSFYVFLTLVLAYQLVTLKSSYPNEDACMGGIIGLVFGIIVTTVAFITCFTITGFSKK
jgi:hypothetical protein